MLPKKSLGQHFLSCQWVVDAIVKTSDLSNEDTVLEVGPGTGVLTRALAKYAGQVIAIEKDEKLAGELRQNLEKEGITNVEIIEGDILKILPSLLSSHKLEAGSWKLVSNIPYYLTARIFRTVFEHPIKPSLIVFTIQKEVAERITAKSGKMSLLAISIQAYGRPEIIKRVPASCFHPAPDVDSSILKISAISDSFFVDNSISEVRFFEIVRLGFSAKRKQLLGNLAKKFPREKLQELFTRLAINPRARAEELSMEKWLNITKSL